MADTDRLRSKEAAAFLRMDIYTLHKLAKEGIIPVARIGTLWRFNPADLENYARTMASQTFGRQKS